MGVHSESNMMRIIILTLAAATALVLGAPQIYHSAPAAPRAYKLDDAGEGDPMRPLEVFKFETEAIEKRSVEYDEEEFSIYSLSEIYVDDVMIDAKIKSERNFEKRSAMEEKAEKIAEELLTDRSFEEERDVNLKQDAPLL